MKLQLIYKSLLFSAIASLTIAGTSISYAKHEIERNLGHGGSFLAAVSIALFIGGLALSTACGLLSASIAFVCSDLLPEKSIYKTRWPLIASLPGAIGIIFYIFQIAQSTL